METEKPSFQYLLKLPGKIYRKQEGRLTKAIFWRGQECFVKLHAGIGWREIFKNLCQGRLPIVGARPEYQALKHLTEVGIPTLEILEFNSNGWNPAAQKSYLITKALHHTTSLETLCGHWQTSSPTIDFKRKIIRQVAKIAAQMHNAGINHRDFYICHFLFDEKLYAEKGQVKLYLMDLHRAQIRQEVPYRWRLKDIGGLYFSVLNLPLTRRDLFLFMKIYQELTLQRLNWPLFWYEVEKKAWTLYQKTFFKKISFQSKERGYKLKMVYDPKYVPASLISLNTPEALFKKAEILKTDATTTVAKILVDEQTLLLKRYNARHLLKIMKRRFGESRAARNWYQAWRLHHLQILTPRPLAKIEVLYWGVIRESYILMEYLAGGEDLSKFLQKYPAALPKMLRQIKNIFTSLAASYTAHGDMKATNLWVVKEKIYLLDLDGMRQYLHPAALAKALAKDKQRFLKNWQNMPELCQAFEKI